MRCQEFSATVSEYVDHSLTHLRAWHMDRHAHECRSCARVLAELTLIRDTLGDLKECSPRAAFKLQLANCLQLALQKRTRLWARPLALGLTIATALVVLLWPDQPPDFAERVAVRDRHFDLALDSYPTSTPRYPGGFRDFFRSSKVQIRTVSY